jgi:hypothetical protein
VPRRRQQAPAACTPTDAPGAITRLEVRRTFPGDPARLCAALMAPCWLGTVVASPPDRPDMTRLEMDLAFTLDSEGGRLLTFKKAALVDIAMSKDGADTCTGEISWRASSFSPLFPVFAGQLALKNGRLALAGVYAPPGGQLGLLFDRTIIHRFAERTARWLLDRIVFEHRELEIAEARRAHESASAEA